MRVKRILPLIMLCALMTSCTIAYKSDRYPAGTAAVSAASEAESYDADLPYAESGEVLSPDTYETADTVGAGIENGDAAPPVPYYPFGYEDPRESGESTPPAETEDSGVSAPEEWHRLTDGCGDTLYYGFEEELTANAYEMLEVIKDKYRQNNTSYTKEELEENLGTLEMIPRVRNTPTENGRFIVKRYWINASPYSSSCEVYFKPADGELRLLFSSPDDLVAALCDGRYLYLYNDLTLYRLSEDGTPVTLDFPVEEMYRGWTSSSMDDPEGRRLTIRLTCRRKGDNGGYYIRNEIFFIDADTMEITGEYREPEIGDYEWYGPNALPRRPYDEDFRREISAGALQYFENEKAKAAGAGMTPEEERLWEGRYTLPMTYYAYSGFYVVKIYGISSMTEYLFYEIYYFERNSSEGRLLHSMSGAQADVGLWGSISDSVRLYFIEDGGLRRISADGTIETVIEIGGYEDWELDRSSSEISGEENLLNAGLCFRSIDPETGSEITRRDFYIVNIDTLEIVNYISGVTEDI